MKRIPTLAIAASLAISASAARHDLNVWPEKAFSSASLEETDTRILVSFDIDTEAFPLKANKEITVTPLLIAGTDTVRLAPVTIAGRTRYFQHRRARDIKAPARLLRDDDTFHYTAITDLTGYDGEIRLVAEGVAAGCCGTPTASLPPLTLASAGNDYVEIEAGPELLTDAEMIYVAPKKELIKTRKLSGKAYIDFPVNKIEIYPDYRHNPAELAAIRATIDKIRSDKDVRITSISFKGYASPEGPYENNVRLAKGRTMALMDYVKGLYSFPESVLRCAWEPEDWDGLTARLLDLDIPNKEAIYDIIINQALTYDQKDLAIKTRYPQQYAYLLREVYPALRHSDYLVEFTVKNYIDVTEIAEVYATNPSKLSQDEIFLYAQTFDRNSRDYRDVIATAVNLFPEDPDANLNAAVAALDEGDLDRAEGYIAKAGTSATAMYTAGVIAARRGDTDKAISLLRKAEQGGMDEATPLIERLTASQRH